MRRMKMLQLRTRLALAIGLIATAAASDPYSRPTLAQPGGFADLAEATLAARAILVGKVRAVVRVPNRDADGLAPNARRYLVRVEVARAILAPGAVPGRIEYLWDAASPRRPEIDDKTVLLFLTPSEGRPDQFRLVRGGQVADTPAAEATTRALVTDARDPVVGGRRVTGVSKAFTVPGSVPGEAETQIFLKTANAQPISLVVVSRPGEAKHYSAAFGDTIDEAAGPVKANTLAWYYLACGLPRTLPDEATAELDEGQRGTVVADYTFVLKALGPCGRTSNEASSTPTEAQSG